MDIRLQLKEALDMGMTPFKDERHKCDDCRFVSRRPFKGKCHKDNIQYVFLLNNCDDYLARVEIDNGKFWE